jgi:hypothetical protein
MSQSSSDWHPRAGCEGGAAEISGIPKITACMAKHRADLSPGRRAAMRIYASQNISAVAQQ